MRKVDLKRIINDCEHCDNEITVSEVTDIIHACVAGLYQNTSIIKRTRQKIGDDDFNILFTSVLSTVLLSIYTSTFKSVEEAMEYGASVGADGVGFIQRKSDA